MPTRTPPTSGPLPIDPWLALLQAALAKARASGDAEAVHQLRIALARAAVWLRLGGHREFRGDLRWLRRAAGSVRDADVRLASTAGRRDRKRLRHLRTLAAAVLATRLGSDRARSLGAALRALPPVPRAAAKRQVRKLARRVLEAGRRAERRWPQAAALHRLRCALRKLRYGLECLGAGARRVARVQAILGDARDCSLAIELSKGASRDALARRQVHAEHSAKKRWKKLKPRLQQLAL